ncbi:DNA-dependent metalloprotease SPRTN [Halotydeus destructor]|nr:DNA-dependent metalloprotease SPRTN [Halotydeus destructor]
MTSPNENSENTYDFGKQSKKSQACKSNFESPLPPSAIFSKYSAQSDPSSVLRKLGIDFDLSAKPDEKLYCSNKKLMTIFAKIDKELFGSALTNNQVEAAWSGRLTKAAGITHYKTKLLMVECDIKLSRPLLKLRPAKDMVETLVHEMIHAYLAVTRNPGHKGHGPEFKKQMARVNQMTGLTITIYHSFHDEVDAYRNQNVWRCDGVCRSLRDFKYGYVRRAINRAPGAHEFWWKKHQQLCGGNFERVYKHPFSNHLENQI